MLLIKWSDQSDFRWLITVKNKIIINFARQPCSLTELGPWIATEFHQLLLYMDLVVLRDVLAKPQ